jgi:hypothetical protein
MTWERTRAHAVILMGEPDYVKIPLEGWSVFGRIILQQILKTRARICGQVLSGILCTLTTSFNKHGIEFSGCLKIWKFRSKLNEYLFLWIVLGAKVYVFIYFCFRVLEHIDATKYCRPAFNFNQCFPIMSLFICPEYSTCQILTVCSSLCRHTTTV